MARREGQGTSNREHGAAQPWERIYVAFFVGLFLSAIVCVPLAMYGLEALHDNIRVVAVVTLTTLMSVAFAFGLVFLFRKPLAKRLRLPPPGLLRDVYDPFIEGLEALRDGRSKVAYDNLRLSSAAAVSFYGWVSIRRWMVRTSLALVAVFATVAGTALLFRQNELIYDQNGLIVEQNAKINEQNRRLRVQNKLLFAQTDVDVSQQFARRDARIQELGRVIRFLNRNGKRIRDTVDVRWCSHVNGFCTQWAAVDRGVKVCDLVVAGNAAAQQNPCVDVPLGSLREAVRSAGKWVAEQDRAHAALQVLAHLERSVRIGTTLLDQPLSKCGVDDVGLDTVAETLAGKERLREVIAVLLEKPEAGAPDNRIQEVLDTLVIGDIEHRLAAAHAGLHDAMLGFLKQCRVALVTAQERLEEERAEHLMLAEEVRH